MVIKKMIQTPTTILKCKIPSISKTEIDHTFNKRNANWIKQRWVILWNIWLLLPYYTLENKRYIISKAKEELKFLDYLKYSIKANIIIIYYKSESFDTIFKMVKSDITKGILFIIIIADNNIDKG